MHGVVLALLLAAGSAFAMPLHFQGQAFHVESGELLYREEHTVQRDEQGNYLSSEVRYLGVNEVGEETLWARKRLLFAEVDGLLPELVFENLRFGGKTSLTLTETTLVIEQQQGRQLEQSSLRRPSDEVAVADAGFDRMIVQSWAQLLAGEMIEFEFLALSRSKWVSFRMFIAESDDTDVTIVVQPANWFFRMLVDPITLHYDREKRRLRRFVGLTNIPKNASGDHYEARIEYLYQDEQRGGPAP